MGYLQNIQSFETSVETGNLQSYEKQSIVTAVKVTLQQVPSPPPFMLQLLIIVPMALNDSDFILIN